VAKDERIRIGVGVGVAVGVGATTTGAGFWRLTANRIDPIITMISMPITRNFGGIDTFPFGVFPGEYTGPYTGGAFVGGNIAGVGGSSIVN